MTIQACFQPGFQIIIRLHYRPKPQPFCFYHADMNQDGTIDVTDAIALVNAIMLRLENGDQPIMEHALVKQVILPRPGLVVIVCLYLKK